MRSHIFRGRLILICAASTQDQLLENCAKYSSLSSCQLYVLCATYPIVTLINVHPRSGSVGNVVLLGEAQQWQQISDPV